MKGKTFAVLALIFGILGMVSSCVLVGLIFDILAIVFGIIALIKNQSKVMSIIGMATGVVGIIIAIAMIIYAINLPPSEKTEKEIPSEIKSEAVVVAEKSEPVSETSEKVEEPSEPVKEDPKKEEKKEEQKNENNKDKEKEFVALLESRMSYYLGTRDKVNEISLNNRNLSIVISLERRNSDDRFTSVTDWILSLDEYYDLWDSVTIDFLSEGKITKTKEDIFTDKKGKHFNVNKSDFIKPDENDKDIQVYYESDDMINKFINDYNFISQNDIKDIQKGNIKSKCHVKTNGCYVELLNAPDFFNVNISIEADVSNLDDVFIVFSDVLKVFDESLSDEEISQIIEDLKKEDFRVGDGYNITDDIVISHYSRIDKNAYNRLELYSKKYKQ